MYDNPHLSKLVGSLQTWRLLLLNVKLSVFQAGTLAWNPSSYFWHTFKAEEKLEQSMYRIEFERVSQKSWLEVSKAAADFNYS